MTAVDLKAIPVVDNHCHALESEHPDGVADWRSRFSESPDLRMRTVDAADTAFYRRLVHAMAAYHGVPDRDDAEMAVLAARGALGVTQLAAALFDDAHVAGLVVDTGYPEHGKALSRDQLVLATGSQQVDLLRLELLFQEVVAAQPTVNDAAQALRATLEDVRGAGYVGFKSIAGYRTGLSIERWDFDAVEAAYAQARNEVERTGAVRLGHKPILDTLLHVALDIAGQQELPVQFHVGYGDPDADLRNASPLELRAVLENPAYRRVPIVLLHGCWPYFREGAFLAAVYGNVYLDLSYGIPFLSVAEMTSVTRSALGAVPFSKLMYSSDGARVPELHWLGAREGRRILGAVLGELITDRELDSREAEHVAQRILADNAWQLYGFAGLLPKEH